MFATATRCFLREIAEDRTKLKHAPAPGASEARLKTRPMMKLTLVCDSCEAVVASGISATEIRLDAQALYAPGAMAEICACSANAFIASEVGPLARHEAKL
jgi:hypothetical protein